MYCKNCGKEVKEGEKFCRECGTSLDNNVTKETKVEPIVADNSTATATPNGKGLAIASLVLGIASFIFGWFFLPLPILGLIFGIVQKGKSGEKTAGIILNSIALVLIVVLYLILGLAFFSLFSTITECSEGEDCFNINEIIEEEIDNNKWDVFSHKRIEASGKEMALNGGWRILSNYNDYWVFNNGEYYIYRDINNKESNYDYGHYTVETGVESIASLGLNQEEVDKFINKLGKDVKNENIYSVTITLEAIEAGQGLVDKEEKYSSKFIWVLIDHGEEGIEARVLDDETYDTRSYVKFED